MQVLPYISNSLRHSRRVGWSNFWNPNISAITQATGTCLLVVTDSNSTHRPFPFSSHCTGCINYHSVIHILNLYMTMISTLMSLGLASRKRGSSALEEESATTAVALESKERSSGTPDGKKSDALLQDYYEL